MGFHENQILALLQKKKELEEVDAVLRAKRAEFAERMETCTNKKLQVQRRREEVAKSYYCI